MLPSGVSNVASENLADDTHPAHTINSCFEIDCLTGKCSEKKLKNVKNIKTIFISARSGRVLRGGQGRILIIPTYKSTRMDPTTFHEDSNSRSTIDDTGHNNYSSTLLSLFSLQRVKSELCELIQHFEAIGTAGVARNSSADVTAGRGHSHRSRYASICKTGRAIL